MYFIGNTFDLKMLSTNSTRIAVCSPTDLDHIKKEIIKYGKVISIFEDKDFCNFVIKTHLQIDENMVNTSSSSFLKSNFLRNDDILFYIDCEKPNCTGHLIFDPKNEEDPFKITGRTEEVNCYMILVK